MGHAEAGAAGAVVSARPGAAPRATVRVRLAWVAFAAMSLACFVATVLDLRNGTYGTIGYVAIAQVLAVLGVLLTTRLPGHRISWVVAGAAGCWAIGGFTQAYAFAGLVEDPGSLPGATAAAWLNSWAWLPGLALFLCLLLVLMPDGHLASRRWWPAPALVASGTALGAIYIPLQPTFDLSGTTVDNPIGTTSAALEAISSAMTVLVITGLAWSLAAFLVRYRRSEGERRQQLRWVAVSLGVAVPLAVVGAVLWGVVPGAAVLPALALLAVPAGISVAVLKYRLYELDLVVNRAVVYAVLSAAVIGSYVAAVGLVGSLLSRRGDLIVSLVVTGVVAIGFQPLRQRVQRFVNRLMYGERDDPFAAMAAVGHTLASSVRADRVLPTAVETIGRTLALQYVGLTSGPDGREVAAYGAPAPNVLGVPLVHRGEPLGELRLAPRPGERLRERDRRLIADLAPQVAAAVHAVGLSQELQSARRRLVELREEERRRIRRDLHDGLGPALAGLTFTLDAVQNLADSDRRRADELLGSATDQVQSMIADIRRLIYGLRPPALDELGLVASLRGLAEREGRTRIRVDVDAPDALPPLGAAVEVAVYRIVQEALTNVARHAAADRCTVRLVLEPSAVVVEVSDDGRGFAQRRVGVGLHAMRERAEELGGRCEVTSRPGSGTTVLARLPREAAEAAGA